MSRKRGLALSVVAPMSALLSIEPRIASLPYAEESGRVNAGLLVPCFGLSSGPATSTA